MINANTGNVGVGVEAGTAFKLQVSGAGHFGDSIDATAYGQLQVTRPATQGYVNGTNVGHCISMIRGGNMCSGLGYKNSSNIMYIKNDFYSNTTTNGIYVDNNKIGINQSAPTTALDVVGQILCGSIKGGQGNSQGNFHIDQNTNNGSMYLNYYSEGNVQIGSLYYSLFDTGNGTHRQVHKYITGSTKVLWDFYKKLTPAAEEMVIGRIEYDGSYTYYRSTSDIRTKENIKPITQHYHILDQLNPCIFTVKSSGEGDVDGFIADELYESYPICTSGKTWCSIR